MAAPGSAQTFNSAMLRGNRAIKAPLSMRTYTTFVKPEELGRLQLFKHVNLTAIEEQLSFCNVREIEAGETLIARGQTNAYFYILLAGRLRVYLDTMGEALTFLEAGQSVGEISIIDKQPTTAHVVAETRCRLLVIGEQTLWSFVSNSHAISINLLSLLTARLRDTNAKLTESQARQRMLEYEATVDPLTGLYNQRWLDKEFSEKMTVAREIEQPLSVLMVELDHFDEYTDANGHLAGDQALHAIAQSLLNNLRPMDTAIRYAGEEYMVVLPDTDLDTAVQVAEDICIIARDTRIHTADGKLLPSISVSIGVASQSETDDRESLIRRAENALATAKDSGQSSTSTGE